MHADRARLSPALLATTAVVLLAVPQAAVAAPYVGGCPTLVGLAGKVAAPTAFPSLAAFIAQTLPQPATLEWVSGGALCTGGGPVDLQLTVLAYSISTTITATETWTGPLNPDPNCTTHAYYEFRESALPDSFFSGAVNEGLCGSPSAGISVVGHHFENGQWYALFFSHLTP